MFLSNAVFNNIDGYLITLDGSVRRDNYIRQLYTHRPCSHVTIVHNKGYKCKKNIPNSNADIWDANHFIFRESQKKGRYILVMEDDIEFTASFKTHGHSIETFLNKNPWVEMYGLGNIAITTIPSMKEHIRVLFGGSAHAIIYSPEAQQKLLNVHYPGTLGGFHDMEFSYKSKMFMSLHVMAIQQFEKSENQKQWNLLGLPLLIIRCMSKLTASTHPFIFSHSCATIGGLTTIAGGIILIIVLLIVIHVNSNAKRVSRGVVIY